MTGHPNLDGWFPRVTEAIVNGVSAAKAKARRCCYLDLKVGCLARSVPAVAGPPSAAGRWLAAGSLDSHLGGARTLILPGRTGPATRESA